MDEMLVRKAITQREQLQHARRDFFKVAGAVAATTAGVAALAGSPSRNGFATEAEAQANPSDQDILNFALNFEYLEGNFYSYVVNGQPIGSNLTSGVGTLGAAVGGPAVPFSDPVVRAFAGELLQDETNHITFIRNQLGANTAVAQPAIDLSVSSTSAFSVAAVAAGAIQQGQTFNPYANDQNFLLAAFLFIEVGVSAYQGAAGLLSSKTFLDAASGILAVEGYHAGAVRSLLYAKGLQTPAILTEVNGVATARDNLDGQQNENQGILVNGTPQLVPTDANGLTYPRTYNQVLNIGYLNDLAVTKGGFFPNGVNGNLNTSGNFG